jgi:two-component system NtrC family sensor kinase
MEKTLHFVEELKRQWVATFDALIDPVMIIGPNHQIHRANLAAAKMAAGKLSGVDVRKIVGMKCHEVLAGRSDPCPGCKLTETLREGSPHQFRLSNVIAEREFEVTSQPFPENDERRLAVHIYRDRTEAAVLQARLVQSEKLASIGLLAGGIAHEINNPLGGIMIFSQMLLREMPKDSPYYSDVVEIEAASQRCKEIVQGLLDFARIRPDQDGQRQFLTVDATEAIQSATRFAQMNLKEKVKHNIRIKENFDAKSTAVRGDKNQIIQVVLNLLQNAIQAMPQGGDISLRVKNDKSMKNLVIEISDSGTGIKPEHLKKIFDPFFTTKQPGQGTGLGLSVCYGLVTGMGGKIAASSKVGEGTTFSITFPLETSSPSS